MGSSGHVAAAQLQAARESIAVSVPLALERLASSVAFAETVMPEAVLSAAETLPAPSRSDVGPELLSLPGHQDIEVRSVLAQGGMVGELGEVHLVDWGIATALAPTDPRCRLTELRFVGTPASSRPR